jgi:hypothetical protein
MIARRTAAFYDKEILKYFVGTEAVKNLVVDATTVRANRDGRYILESGQVMSAIARSTKVAPAAERDLLEADVVGILAHTIEFFGVDDADYDEPAAAFFWNAIFDTTKLISYTDNATNVKAALSSCRFE